MCISSFAKMSRTPDRQPRDACSSHVGLSVGWSVGLRVMVGAADGSGVVGAAVVGAGESVGAADGAAVVGGAADGASVGRGVGTAEMVGASVVCAAARPRAHPTRASRRRRILSSAASMARADGVTGEELREACLGFKTGQLVGRAYDETLRGQPFRPWRRLRGSLSARRDASIDKESGFSPRDSAFL